MIRVNLAPTKTVGHALDRFIGTWTAEEEAELLQAVEIFERVDESYLWLDEAERRDQAVDADPSRAIPGDEVMREARALLSRL